MIRISLVEQAHLHIAKHLKPGDIAIDATAGNGHDTQFLAQQVIEKGQVYSFDIQVIAIKNTLLKLQQSNLSKQVKLIHAGHQHWLDHIPEQHLGSVSAIMFNLGYLPGGDKSITTVAATTIATLRQIPLLLKPKDACLTLIVYPGHEQGRTELAKIEDWLQQLDKTAFTINMITIENTRSIAPQLFMIKTIGH